MSVVFNEAAGPRIERFVRRTERQPLGNPLDDGQDRPPIPSPVMPEVLITGDASTTCRPICPGKFLVWDDSCGFNQAEDCWVYEINDAALTTQNYPGRLMMSNFQRVGGDSTTFRPLVEVQAVGSAADTTDVTCDTVTFTIPNAAHLTVTDLEAFCSLSNLTALILGNVNWATGVTLGSGVENRSYALKYYPDPTGGTCPKGVYQPAAELPAYLQANVFFAPGAPMPSFAPVYGELVASGTIDLTGYTGCAGTLGVEDYEVYVVPYVCLTCDGSDLQASMFIGTIVWLPNHLFAPGVPVPCVTWNTMPNPMCAPLTGVNALGSAVTFSPMYASGTVDIACQGGNCGAFTFELTP